MIVLVLGGCLADQPHAVLGDERAEALFEEVEGYRAWERPPVAEGEPLRQGASGPHGAFVEVFLDPILAEAQRADATLLAWPVGSTAVADGYADELATAPMLVNIARKTEHGWEWAQLEGDGRGLAYGRLEDCIACHGNGMDRIFSIDLPEIEEEE